MDQNELLNFVADALDRHGIPYAVTGSHASSAYGEQRLTNDIDVVIALRSRLNLAAFLAEFPLGQFSISDMGAEYAVDHGGQFNIIDEDSFQKIDVIIPREPNWPDQLARRVRIPVGGGREVWFMSPEDLILRKMDFYREGGSDKHLRDISAMLQISDSRIDRGYIDDWATRLDLSDIWQSILARLKNVP